MNIVPFNYGSQEIRTVVNENGETLFVGKDVATILGYKDTNNAIKQHCNGVAKHHPIVDALGRTQDARVINEPDMYRLITNSKLPDAQKFEAWIFEEVLPTVRKTGSYQIQKKRPETLLSVDKEFRAAVRMAKAAGLKGNNAVLSANVLARKITGTDCLELLGATHLITVDQQLHFTPTEIGAQIDGKSGQYINKILTNMGLQDAVKTKKKLMYIPTSKGKKFTVLTDTGKQRSDGSMVQQVRWKQNVVQLIKEATA